jgi:hypothetical protein
MRPAEPAAATFLFSFLQNIFFSRHDPAAKKARAFVADQKSGLPNI